MRAHLAGALIVSLGSAARADVELKNDGFASGGQAVAELGFGVNDIGASRYVAPSPGRQVMRVQLIFGGMVDGKTETITFKVWDDTAGTDAPGAELYSNDFTLTASDSALSEISIATDNVIVPQQFRAGIVFSDPTHSGAPTLCRDNDGNITADKNYLYDPAVGWKKSTGFGLTGDWIMRAFVSGDGGGGPDAGTGAACSGNADCPIGQFCDVPNHSCTFECRTPADCENGTCNSLGMCIADNGGGGGCCQTGERGSGALLLGIGVVILICRRRHGP